MALATDLLQGEVLLTADIHGSIDPYAPELTATGVVPGEYILPSIVVDQKGRVLYLEEYQLDLPCATPTTCGGVKPVVHIDVAAGEISIPDATISDHGVVQIGTGFASDGCCINLDYPEATNSTVGVVSVGIGLDVDVTGILSTSIPSESAIGGMQVGDGLDVDGNGIVSVDLTEVPPLDDATEVSKGIMQVGNGLDVTAGVVSVDLTEVQYQDTTISQKGIMQVGNGLDVTAGVVSVDLDELSGATVSSKGVVQIGSNIDVAAGEISIPLSTDIAKGVATIGSSFGASGNTISLPISTAVVLGGIIVGNELGIDGSGILSRGNGDATYSSKGIVQIGVNTGLDVTAGDLSPITTTISDKGIVQIGSNINVAAGVVSVDTADNTTLGLVNSADTNNITITAGAIDVGPDVAKINTSQEWDGNQFSDLVVLSFSASITPDFSLSNIFEITLTGNTTINSPTNANNGGDYYLIIKQDGTGGHTVSFGSDFKFLSTPTTTTDINAVDIFQCVRYSATEYISQYISDYK